MTDTYTPPEPDASIFGFQSEVDTVHLLSTQQWGPNPECTSKFTRGHTVTVTQKEITCKKCQAKVVGT